MIEGAMRRLGFVRATKVPVADLTDESMFRMMSIAFQMSKHNLRKSFDYPPEVTETMTRMEYQRNAVAHACVDRIIQATWRTPPRIEDQEREEGTLLEETMRKHFKKIGFWRSFERADEMALIGNWSGLILQVADSTPLSEPMEGIGRFGGIEAIERAVPVWRSQLRPEFDDMGDVTHYQYHPGRSVTDGDFIHPSRVIIVSENGRFDASGLLTRLYNANRNAETVAGSAAQMAWNAARTLLYLKMAAGASQQEMNKDKLGNTDGSTFADRLEQMMQAVNTGLMSTISAPAIEDATQITHTLGDPSGSFDVISKTLAAGSGVPFRILFGSEEGRLASDQDTNAFYERMEGRRERVINPLVEDFIMRMKMAGAIPMDDGREYGAVFEPLNETATKERAETANLLEDINTKSMMNGEGMKFDVNEIREAAGYREWSEREIQEREREARRRVRDMPPDGEDETTGGAG